MSSVPFKTNLIDSLKKKDLADSTIKNYVRNLELLNDGKELKNLNFLHDTEYIMGKLNDYKDNTKRGYLIAIVAALDTSERKKDKSIRAKYYNLMINKSKEIKEKQPANQKSETQANNWITWEDVVEKYENLDKQVESFINAKTISPMQYDVLLARMVLALYIFDPSRRNMDFLKMNVVKKYNDEMPNDSNYLDLTNGRFIFNVYKTAKKYGKKISQFNDSLKEVMMEYFKFHPLMKGKKLTEPVPFLVYSDGKPFVQQNAITRILNAIFAPKKIGASMLRHIYLSSKYGDILKEQEKDAEIMGHSVSMQREYIKTEEPNETITNTMD